MERQKKDYLIESNREPDRLDFQNKIDVYDLNLELEAFSWDSSHRILDAGCGHGNLIDKLISKNIRNVHGIDLCNERIELAKQRFKDYPSLKFTQGALEKTYLESSTYDTVICRYIFEHLLNHHDVISELSRLIKPGGNFFIINFDDLLFNFSTKNQWLNQKLKKLEEDMPYDFKIGRKLPQMLKLHGFDVAWEAQTYFFQGERLKLEHENYQMRFEQAAPMLSKYFDNDSDYDLFVKTYLCEMQDEGNVLGCTKFLIKGVKKSAEGEKGACVLDFKKR